MKKYILFAYLNYYPSGGLSDIVGDFDTLEEAKEEIVRLKGKFCPHDNFDIVDRDTWDYVYCEEDAE